MAKVGDSAHTDHGLGIITEVDTVRGRSSFRVAGRGFNVWIDEQKLHTANDGGNLFSYEFLPGRHHMSPTEEQETYIFGGLDATIDPGQPYHVNDSNSTVLPYNPTPQHHVDMFRSEQNIQPGDYETDRDDRLRSSDSLTGESRSPNRPYPGPNPDLFAKSSSARYAEFEEEPDYPAWGSDEWHQNLDDGPERTFGKDAGAHDIPGMDYSTKGGQGRATGELVKPYEDGYNEPGYMKKVPGEPGEGRHREAGRHDAPARHLVPMDDVSYQSFMNYEGPQTSGGQHESYPYWPAAEQQGGFHGGPINVPNVREREAGLFNRHTDPHDPKSKHYDPAGYMNPDPHHEPGSFYEGPRGETMFDGEVHDDWLKRVTDDPVWEAAGFHRPAGLSNRYAHIEPLVDHDHPITAFRRDPDAFIQAAAYLGSSESDEEHLNDRFAAIDALEDTDVWMKTAKWADVRSKAMRLRKDGKVKVNDIGPDRIYATVQGDHGTYETMITKRGSMGYFGGGQSITNWYCGCEWGNWAFKRRYSYVGRLCSHGYAAYLEMQSRHIKENPQEHFKKPTAIFASRQASVVDDYKKWLETNDYTAEPDSVADFVHTSPDPLDPDEVEQLYDYIHEHPAEVPERNYDVPYTFDEDKVYKQSDLLYNQPRGLSPSLQQVPQGDTEDWVDVEKDERKTTGPDQIVHFSSHLPSSVIASLHTADGETPFGHLWHNLTGQPAPSPGGNPGSGPTAGGELGRDIGKWWSQTPIGQAMGGGGTPQPANLTSDTRNQGGAPATPGTPGAPGTPSTETNAYVPAAGEPPVGGYPTPAADLKPGQTRDPSGQVHDTTMTPEAVKNSLTGTGTGSAAGGAFGTGQGYGGAGYQGAGGTSGNWQQSKETTGIGPGGANTTAEGLAQASGIKDPNLITPGQQIKGPGGASYTVKPGETLTDISNRMNAPAGGTSAAGTNIHNEAGPAGTNIHNEPGTPPAPSPLGGPSRGNEAGPPKPPQPPQPPTATNIHSSLVYRLHQAADDDNDDDEPRPDFTEAASDLDKLRDLCQEDPSEHYQHMDSHNQEIADLIEDLEDAGVGASQFVAMLHSGVYEDKDRNSDPAAANSNFRGLSSPDWADLPFAGSGPNPKGYISDSQSYVKAHEAPRYQDVTDLGDEDIIKYNDSRSKPPQGPRQADLSAPDSAADGPTLSQGTNALADPTYTAPAGGTGYGLTDPANPYPLPRSVTSGYYYAGPDDPDSGYFNPENATEGDWEAGTGKELMDEVKKNAPSMPNLGGDGEEEGAGEAGGEAAAAEDVAPMLLAAGSGFSLDAFDRGEFSYADPGGGAGPLRRASRVGGGPTQQVRVDDGYRGHQAQTKECFSPPSDFGNDGDPQLTDYGEPAATPMGSDILAQFHRSGAAAGIYASSYGMGNSGGDDDIAAHANAFLRTAGRKYTPAEQRELEAEFHPQGARNLPTDDELRDTHYALEL